MSLRRSLKFIVFFAASLDAAFASSARNKTHLRIFMDNFGSLEAEDGLVRFKEEWCVIRLEAEANNVSSIPLRLLIEPLHDTDSFCRGCGEVAISYGSFTGGEDGVPDETFVLRKEEKSEIPWPLEQTGLQSLCAGGRYVTRMYVKVSFERRIFRDQMPLLRLRLADSNSQDKAYWFNPNSDNKATFCSRLAKSEDLLVAKSSPRPFTGISSREAVELSVTRNILDFHLLHPVNYYDKSGYLTPLPMAIHGVETPGNNYEYSQMRTLVDLEPQMISTIFEIMTVIDFDQMPTNVSSKEDPRGSVEVCLHRSAVNSTQPVGVLQPWCVSVNNVRIQNRRLIIGWPSSRVGSVQQYEVTQFLKVSVKDSGENPSAEVPFKVSQKVVFGPTHACPEDCNLFGRCATLHVQANEFQQRCYCWLGFGGNNCEIERLYYLSRFFQAWLLEVTNVACLAPALCTIYIATNGIFGLAGRLKTPNGNKSTDVKALITPAEIQLAMPSCRLMFDYPLDVEASQKTAGVTSTAFRLLNSRRIGGQFILLVMAFQMLNVGWWSTVYHRCESTGVCFNPATLGFEHSYGFRDISPTGSNSDMLIANYQGVSGGKVLRNLIANRIELQGTLFDPPLVEFDEDCIQLALGDCADVNADVKLECEREKMRGCRRLMSSVKHPRIIEVENDAEGDENPKFTHAAARIPPFSRSNSAFWKWNTLKRMDFFFAYTSILTLIVSMGRMPLWLNIATLVGILYGVNQAMLGVQSHDIICVRRIVVLGFFVTTIPFIFALRDIGESPFCWVCAKFAYSRSKYFSKFVSPDRSPPQPSTEITDDELCLEVPSPPPSDAISPAYGQRFSLFLYGNVMLISSVLSWQKSSDLKANESYWFWHSIWHVFVESTPAFWICFKYYHRMESNMISSL